jgi:hypothetical protein
MEIVLDKKDKTLNSIEKKNKLDYWNDSLIQDYYINYYQNLSAKELDKEFNKDIRTLTKALSKLPDSERKAFIDVLSRVIEFYLENKIEKEIDHSLFKILKF